jgi:HEXXH motif-containing protein
MFNQASEKACAGERMTGDVVPASASDPWEWRPSRAAWLARFDTSLATPFFHGAIDVDLSALRSMVGAAAAADAAWMFHPCMSALLRRDGSLRAGTQALGWICIHTGVGLGAVELNAPLWLWQQAGGEELAPGRHQLLDLGRRMRAAGAGRETAIDGWFDSAALDDSGPLELGIGRLWREGVAQDGAPDDVGNAITADIVRCLRSLHILRARLPRAADWFGNLIQVIVPLRAGPGTVFNSASYADLPGLVFADMRDESSILEALVHETAHHYFRLAEAAAPLIAGEDGARYRSPLREDLRPLRGVFLAFHALAYICALFADLRDSEPGLGGDAELGSLRSQCDAARDTLRAAGAKLTPEGREFFARTEEVASHGR